jgi:ferredoxin-NADP reductase
VTEVLNVLISGRKEQIAGIITLDLLPVASERLPSFDAGAHVDVHIAPGIVRQYSLCNDPAEIHRYRIGVLRESQSRGGSVEIHSSFLNGRRVHISRPRNHFPLAEDSGPSILVGGGIGITPLIAMAHHLHSQKRDFRLHYCVRSRGRAAFLAELQHVEFRQHVLLHCDDGLPEQRFNLQAALGAGAHGTHVYACGPSGFVDSVVNEAKRAKLAPARMHVERFQRDLVPASADREFIVVAHRSGQIVKVPPETTIATALARAGVAVELSCEQGICGTCITDVLEGVPEHRDMYLTDTEKTLNNRIAVCCSRSLTDILVLDV